MVVFVKSNIDTHILVGAYGATLSELIYGWCWFLSGRCAQQDFADYHPTPAYSNILCLGTISATISQYVRHKLVRLRKPNHPNL